MKRILLMTVILCSFLFAQGQILNPVKWSYGSKRLSSTEGVVFIKATIDDGWHIYSQTVKDGGPVKTSFTFEPSKAYELTGSTQEPKPVTRLEKVFDMEISYFESGVIFQQKVKLKIAGPVTIKGNLEYMTCNDEKCLPPETVPFSVTIK